jgi:glycosyltransferase involved in cell wall biosynthesis
MKIIIYSASFWPNLGGVEDVGNTMAAELTKLGCEVTVVTPVPLPLGVQERNTNYKIVRAPEQSELNVLIGQVDLIHFNGASFAILPQVLQERKPCTAAYHGYQMQCIDGAGWMQGKAAPMKPVASFVFHAGESGLPRAIAGGGKLLLRRLAAYFLNANIATSEIQMKLQPLPKQRLIYNPVDTHYFKVSSLEKALDELEHSNSNFTFMGRLISEKGGASVLYALKMLSNKLSRQLTMKFIGDGPERENLIKLAKDLGLQNQVSFAGIKKDNELLEEIRRSGIFIQPSIWVEPGALSTVELLAAGKPLIVSRHGSLSEYAGPACLTFENGSVEELAVKMEELLTNKTLQVSLIEQGLSRLALFDPVRQCRQYLELFKELLVSG